MDFLARIVFLERSGWMCQVSPLGLLMTLHNCLCVPQSSDYTGTQLGLNEFKTKPLPRHGLTVSASQQQHTQLRKTQMTLSSDRKTFTVLANAKVVTSTDGNKSRPDSGKEFSVGDISKMFISF